MCFGPGCRSIQSAVDGCEKDWWKNMLYINNFGNGNGENFATVSLLSKYNTERFWTNAVLIYNMIYYSKVHWSNLVSRQWYADVYFYTIHYLSYVEMA